MVCLVYYYGGCLFVAQRCVCVCVQFVLFAMIVSIACSLMKTYYERIESYSCVCVCVHVQVIFKSVAE